MKIKKSLPGNAGIRRYPGRFLISDEDGTEPAPRRAGESWTDETVRGCGAANRTRSG